MQLSISLITRTPRELKQGLRPVLVVPVLSRRVHVAVTLPLEADT